MKKYLQICIVLGLFFAVVMVKNLRGGNDQQRIIQTPTSLIPTSAPQDTVPPPAAVPQGSTPPPASTPVTAVTVTPVPQKPKGQYRDGSYAGSVQDAYYGNIQVQAIISSGKLTDVQFLQYPNDNRTSLSINSQALPILRDEAVQAQSANIDIVSGASESSPAFISSLASALSHAK